MKEHRNVIAHIELSTTVEYLKKAPNKEHRNYYLFFRKFLQNFNLKKAPNKEHRSKLKNSSKIASRIGFVVCIFWKL